jgi:glyoxylase-like metal-dependent hydrolase (beta-lactamase superfamily II)
MTRDAAPGDALHLIDLDQDLPGQRRFISCWARIAADLAYVVDPGPPATGSRLVQELEVRGLERLDFILLTHVHLDHGGTTAGILERWPDARVVCHERGRAHLVDPSRLWQGSLAVLGHKARVYGEPRPVPADSLAGHDEAAARGIAVIDTPGHAPHHVSFVHDGHLFLGEAAGTYATLGRGDDTAEPYLRPATPPRFRLDVARASLDRLLAVEPEPHTLHFAHHGRHTGPARTLLQAARRQLGLWMDTCAEVAAARGAAAIDDELMDAAAAELVLRDPAYARGALLPEDIRERERDFTRQTLRGMLGAILEETS